MPDSPILIALPLAVAWSAACWDLLSRRVPNALVLSALATGFTVQAALGGIGGLLAGLGGLFVGLAVLLPGYLAGATGAGDVKLMGAVGSFLGAADAFFAGVASLAIGAIIALGFLLSALVLPGSDAPWRRYGLMLKTVLSTGRPVYLAPAKSEVMGRRFPFAVSIALGTTAILVLQGPLAGAAS